MTNERVQRRLAAVLAADVVGYSRLMGASEEGTLARLKAIRKTIVDPAIAEHRGRIVKTTGDGVLVEFASAVDAVRCAVEVQHRMAEQNRDVPQPSRIDFRIGIHVGDIIIDDNDIFGDGVNIAARLEGIAEPGAVCISDDAQRQIRGKVDLAFDDMGQQALKNIAEPMRTWRLRVGATPLDVGQVAPGRQKPGENPGETRPVAETPAVLALPDKPSIAVLPFQNMSGDAEQEYFADGMAEDIITALSRFKSLFVIARNSSFTYKGKSVDIRQVGRELGVRYVLEGSVRKAGNRVRITGQLIDAATDRHLWADKFDGALEDVFGLQDQVTASVVGVIAPTLEQAEIERTRQKPTDRLDSYDLFLRGMASLNKMKALSEAREFFKKAFEQDPDYGAAYAMAAATLMMQQAARGVPLTAEMRAEAIRLADAGSTLAGDDAFVLAISGHVLTYLGHEYDRGASMVERAVSLNPNLAVAWYSRGWVTLMCGEAERSIESFDRMIRLSPLDRLRTSAWNGSSFALYQLGRYDEGCAIAMKSIQLAKHAHTLAAFAVNASSAGRTTDAMQTVAELLKLHPGFRTSHVREAFPVRDPDQREKMAVALREAGLPD
ncbi:MAG TPA: adenylate/guanylate cyclase domain-containing protein [Methylovirgula sp.]